MKIIAIAMTVAIAGIAQGVKAAESYAGRITFHGSIVEDTCTFDQQATRLQMSCGSDKIPQKNLLSLSTLDVISQPVVSTYTVSKELVNKEKREAIITVEYK
ncbi:hypothetical protein ACL00O_19180 [Aeromonas sanarellii]|uniref:hypothetical protein n=1 Tax=Aeromonas sanarellii TaxID=633415 RepID=UPI00399F3FC0